MKNFSELKTRIRKNEGYSNKVYKDQLGYKTIGYGHLIKKPDKFIDKKEYSKKYLNKIFEKDFNLALKSYKKHYGKQKNSKIIQGILIEMIFQLGIKNCLNFKKFNKRIKKKLYYLAAIEMLDSLWYLQTPKRVEGHIKTLLKHNND